MLHLYCRCGIDWTTTVTASVVHSGDTWTGRCQTCKLELEAWAVAGPRLVEVRTHGFYPHVPKPLD
jgi:hypothetical protein